MVDEIDPPEDIENIDDLIEYLSELAERYNDLANRVENINTNVNGLFARAGEFDDRLDRQEGRFDRLEDQVEIMDVTMPKQQKTKLQKVRNILEYALTEGTGGRAGVKIDTAEATAAAGSSRQTARRLMDEIGATMPWADVETPGGQQPKQLKLAIRDRDVEELMDDVRTQFGGIDA